MSIWSIECVLVIWSLRSYYMWMCKDREKDLINYLVKFYANIICPWPSGLFVKIVCAHVSKCTKTCIRIGSSNVLFFLIVDSGQFSEIISHWHTHTHNEKIHCHFQHYSCNDHTILHTLLWCWSIIVKMFSYLILLYTECWWLWKLQDYFHLWSFRSHH